MRSCEDPLLLMSQPLSEDVIQESSDRCFRLVPDQNISLLWRYIFFPQDPCLPPHYSSSISLTSFKPVTRPGNFDYKITALHPAFTRHVIQKQTFIKLLLLSILKKLIGLSIKLLIVKYWAVYSNFSMFSSSIVTVCQDLIREQITQDWCGNPVRPVFHQWRWSGVVFEIVTQFSNSPSPKWGHWQQDYLYFIGWKSALSTISTGN